jgi:hypothetical protein
MERREGTLPLALVHEVVEVRDDVSQRTTAMTEGDAAVHATSALGTGFFFRPVEDEFVVVADAFLWCAPGWWLA